jgi:hypothetical protein
MGTNKLPDAALAAKALRATLPPMAEALENIMRLPEANMLVQC